MDVCVYRLLDTHITVFGKWSMPGKYIAVHQILTVNNIEKQQHKFIHTINRWTNRCDNVDKTLTYIHIQRQRKFQFDDESVLNYVFALSLSLFVFLCFFCCCWWGFLVFNIWCTQNLTFPHCLLFIHSVLFDYSFFILSHQIHWNTKFYIVCLMFFYCLSHTCITSSNNPL